MVPCRNRLSRKQENYIVAAQGVRDCFAVPGSHGAKERAAHIF